MITALMVFIIATLYALSPTVPGGLDPESSAADLARALGPLMAATAALSSFPATRLVRLANVVFGIALIVSPIVVPGWAPTALVIQGIVGLWVTGLSLLPRDRDVAISGGGWRHVLSSPSTIDRIETAAEL